MTGNASFNTLNASDLTGGRLQGGLFEMHVGKDGFSGRIGMGGTNLSVGTIASSLSGFVDTMKIGTAKLGAAFGQYEGVSTLNGANMLGYTNNDFNYTLGKNLWSGKLKATYADVGDEYGRYDSRNPGEIVLSDRLLGNGLDKAAMLASVMSHEGTHAYGNRYEALAHQQGLITYASLAEQFEFQTDAKLVSSMAAGIFDAASYVENTGPIDYWRPEISAQGVTWVDDNSYDIDMSAFGLGVIAAGDVGENAEAMAAAMLAAGEQFGLDLNQATMLANLNAFGSLGVNAVAFKDVIAAADKDGYSDALGKYKASIGTLLNQELSFEGLPEIPDQSVGYNPMRGPMILRGDYGQRVLTPGMVAGGVSGVSHFFGLFNHLGLDFTADDPSFISPLPGRLEINPEWGKSFGLQTTWIADTDERLEFNHNSANAIDAITRTVLANGGWNIAGGMAVGGTGIRDAGQYWQTTGASTGPHLDLRRFLSGADQKDRIYSNPFDFYANNGINLNYTSDLYTKYLSGYADGTSYASLVPNVSLYSYYSGNAGFLTEFLRTHNLQIGVTE